MNSYGQSLLELTIAIGVAVLVISALTFTTIIGIRNSQYAQNQLNASKLAQEGLEHIRSMRERIVPICYNGTPFNWNESSFWSLDPNVGEPRPFYIGNEGPLCQLTDNAALAPSESTINGIFSRKIFIERISGDQTKKFTTRVSWTDYSGLHQSELVTYFADIR